MKISYLLIFFILGIQCLNLTAQNYEVNQITVGKEPISIINNGNSGVYIFCGGWDANYNKKYEPDQGDEYPTLWKISKSTDSATTNGHTYISEKVFTFDFDYFILPFRPAIVDNNGDKTMFLTNAGRLLEYSFNQNKIVEDTVSSLTPQAISFWNNRLFLSMRTYTGQDYALVFDPLQKNVTDTIKSYTNISQILPFTTENGDFLAILNEGNFGTQDSKVQIIGIKDGKFSEIKAIEAGSVANHVAYNKNRKELVVTMNGSHEILLVSTDDFSIKTRLAVPTFGYDGPRESAYSGMNDNILFTTAYSGNVYEYDLNTSKLIDSIRTIGKAESIFAGNSILTGNDGVMVINSFILGGYTPDSTVQIFSNFTGVDFPAENNYVPLYPNPANKHITVNLGGKFPPDIKNLVISNEMGEIYQPTYYFSEGKIEIDINSMEAGFYSIRIQNNLQNIDLQFIKIRE